MAGKRAGLKHSANGDDETTRSGLFMEAVRIIKEMRRATNGEYPKYAIWENVMGAFSSNSGEDFRVVLEELIKICEPEAPPIPSPGKAGWAYADCIVGDGWSLAWRVFDAQHWGVAQRRRRVYALLSLADECAEKVLFERPGLYGHFTESRTPWQGAAEDPQGSPGTDHTESGCLTPWDVQSRRIFATDGTWPSLYGGEGGGHGYAAIPVAFAQNQRDELRDLGDKAGSLQAEPGMKQQTFIIDNIGGQAEYGKESQVNGTLRAGAHGAIAYCFDARGNGGGETVNTLTGDHNNRITDYSSVVTEVYSIDGDKIGKAERVGGSGLGIRDGDKMYTLTSKDAGTHAVAYCMAHGQANAEICKDLSPTVSCNHEQPIVFDRAFFNQGQNAKYDPQFYTDGTVPTMVAQGPSGVCTEYIVRRLTPTECARLQGFPDRWGDIPQKDTLTDEEYSFWLDVRNTHAAINGRSTKEYTKEQMLKWYNKLHSDSSEYKMWGNGIALPNALYVMQGMAEVMNNARI